MNFHKHIYKHSYVILFQVFVDVRSFHGLELTAEAEWFQGCNRKGFQWGNWKTRSWCYWFFVCSHQNARHACLFYYSSLCTSTSQHLTVISYCQWLGCKTSLQSCSMIALELISLWIRCNINCRFNECLFLHIDSLILFLLNNSISVYLEVRSPFWGRSISFPWSKSFGGWGCTLCYNGLNFCSNWVDSFSAAFLSLSMFYQWFNKLSSFIIIYAVMPSTMVLFKLFELQEYKNVDFQILHWYSCPIFWKCWLV